MTDERQQWERDRDAWTEYASIPRDPESRRRLARAEWHWRLAAETAERESRQRRQTQAQAQGDTLRFGPEKEARLDAAYDAYVQRNFPPGSRQAELRQESILADRMAATLQQRMADDGWSEDLQLEVREWRLKALKANDAAMKAMREARGMEK